MKIRIINIGLGAIGSEIARVISLHKGMEIVGAVDIDKEKVGRDLGEVIGLGRMGVIISDKAEEILVPGRADLVILSTRSHLPQVYPEIVMAIKARMDVISTCEELFYPQAQYPSLAEEIDSLAKEYGVTVLGTGINPGFIMDILPLALTGVCQKVRRIEITRVVDSSQRRVQLQRKTGAGLNLEEFKRKAGEGDIGHIGLMASLRMLADSFGWRLERIEQSLEPIIAEETVKSEFITVEKGKVAGIRQIASGFMGGEEVIRLELQIAIGLKGPRDIILIEGIPNIKLSINGGISGDKATAAIVVNSIPRVLKAPPGLITMREIPIVFAI